MSAASSPGSRALAASAGLAAALAGLMLLGCGAEPAGDGERRVVDLLAALPAALVQAETGLIDLGTEAAVPHLHDGWSWSETAGDGTSIRWGIGESSTLTFYSDAPRAIELELRCWPYVARGLPRQRVRVELNGEPVGVLELEPGWQERKLELPAAGVRAGENRIGLRYRYHRVPPGSRVERSVAVAWDWIRIAGSASGERPRVDPGLELLYLPHASQVDYFLDLPAGARLRADRLRPNGPAGGRLVVSVAGDGGDERVVAELAAAADDLDLPLTSADGLARLRLRSVGGGPAAGDGPGSGFAVRHPRVVAGGSRSAAPAVAAPRSPAPRSGPPHVFVYLVDTLRADRLGAYGSPAGLTPNLDAFAVEGVVFRSAIAQAAATLPSTASIFTGVWPREHGALREDRKLPGSLPTLPRLLAGAGYRTAAAVANGFVTEPFGFSDGFDHFVFHGDQTTPTAELRRSLFDWLDASAEEGPLFLYLHSIEPHDAYAPPEEFHRRFAAGVELEVGSKQTVKELKSGRRLPTPELERGMEALYDAEVAYADAEFGRFLEGLRRRGLYEEALIVFTSDHGEEFFDHGSWMHGHTLYGELLDVPLIVRLPGGRGGGRGVDERAQQIDLLPTILDVAGLPAPPGLRGRALFGGSPGESSPAEVFSAAGEELVGLTRGRWKLSVRLPAYLHTGVELYDLVADPGERRNLRDQRPVVAGYLLGLIRQELQRVAGVEPARRRQEDEEVAENLRGLGYIN